MFLLLVEQVSLIRMQSVVRSFSYSINNAAASRINALSMSNMIFIVLFLQVHIKHPVNMQMIEGTMII